MYVHFMALEVLTILVNGAPSCLHDAALLPSSDNFEAREIQTGLHDAALLLSSNIFGVIDLQSGLHDAALLLSSNIFW